VPSLSEAEQTRFAINFQSVESNKIEDEKRELEIQVCQQSNIFWSHTWTKSKQVVFQPKYKLSKLLIGSTTFAATDYSRQIV
jgi:hypothetical protein